MKIKKIIKEKYNNECRKKIKKLPPLLIYYIFFNLPSCSEVEMFVSFELEYIKSIVFPKLELKPIFKELMPKIETYRSKDFPWISLLLFYCLVYCNSNPYLRKKIQYIRFSIKDLILKISLYSIHNLNYHFNFCYFIIYFIIHESLKFGTK